MSETNISDNNVRQRRDRKPEVLKAATKLFGIHGFKGTTLSLVAKAVGLSEPGLLHYFPSKAHLLQGVLDYRDKKDEEKYGFLLELSGSALFDSMGKLISENEKKPGLVRLFTILVSESITEDHPSHEYFVNRYSVIRTRIEKQLTNYLDSEGLDLGSDIKELASLIIAVMDGLQIQWLLNPEAVSMSAAYTLFSKIIIDYLNS